jgi:Glycosyl transferase family 2
MLKKLSITKLYLVVVTGCFLVSILNSSSGLYTLTLPDLATHSFIYPKFSLRLLENSAHSEAKREIETVSLCCVVKDEEAYLDEWVDYHLALGFTDIILYDNSQNKDLSNWKRISRLSDPRIDIVNWPAPIKQIEGLLECAKRSISKSHTWTAFFDVDEFLILRKHSDIISFLQAHCHSGALSINWLVFGNSNHSIYLPLPVTKRFTFRMPSTHYLVKSIVRLSDLNVTLPQNAHFQFLKSGTQHDTSNKSFIGPYNPGGPEDVSVLHHYWTKSTKEFHLRSCIRGANTADSNSSANYPNCGKLPPPECNKFDDTAWNELKKRIPWYAVYD